MKSKEELTALKAKVETVSKKLRELTDDELEQVSGGNTYMYDYTDSDGIVQQRYSALQERPVEVD